MRESNFVDSSLQSRKFKFLTWQNFQVISVGDKFWSECRLDQRQGLVPGASIAPVNLSPLRAGQRICVARSGYIAQQPGDLNIKKGIRVTPDKYSKQTNFGTFSNSQNIPFSISNSYFLPNLLFLSFF